MSTETADPVVEPKVEQEISPQAEETTPKPDAEVSTETKAEEPKKPAPLEPGGDRFKEVWARAKRAEAEKKALEAEYQREREERIRLEERQRIEKEKKETQPEWTDEQLDAWVTEGRYTQSQVNAYKKEILRKQILREVEAKREQETSNAKILGELDQYKSTIPDVMTYGSENRGKYEKEFLYMTRNLGMPDNYATQLAAARAAFGDLETVKLRKASSKVITSDEPFMETHTPAKSKSDKKDFASTLDDRSKKHFEKMMSAGVYKSWEEIEAEQKWTPKVVRTGK